MLGFGIAATGVTDLTQNRGPDIVMNEGPVGGENYSDFVSINLTVDDYENDSFIVKSFKFKNKYICENFFKSITNKFALIV